MGESAIGGVPVRGRPRRVAPAGGSEDEVAGLQREVPRRVDEEGELHGRPVSPSRFTRTSWKPFPKPSR